MVFSFPDDLWSCDIKRFHSPHGTNLPWPDTKLYECLGYLLYGDVMTSSSAEGNTAVVNRYTSGYSASISCRTLVPTPDPVPVNNGKGGIWNLGTNTSQCPRQIQSQAYVILLPYARLNNGKLLKSWCQHQGL